MILLLDERQRKELAQYSPYIAIPKVSSQNRRYIPMDYLEGEIIPGDKLFTMPSATSYEFGILMSNVHMAWTRAVCGDETEREESLQLTGVCKVYQLSSDTSDRDNG